ncbi:transketolase [Francisellaceae bacterium]|nr:transketolase [Francisellaceae bacterium]
METLNQLANAIRFLSMDAVQKANSGHPGMPMGMADIAAVLWAKHLKHNPENPNWENRDRFVLSNGHGSMLLYSLLHLTGYELSIEDIQNFRQLHSKTAGHPEYGYAPGIETTTGPLGQGLANGVGMALAEKVLAAEFNKDGHDIIDHHTYVFLGDGCLMEGISHEVSSLAGTLGLGKLIVFWDDNGISIDGETKGWFTENVPERFTSYGWHVISNIDGHNKDDIDLAITAAKQTTDAPTLICCETKIGKGSPNKGGKASSHGAPLGDEEIALTRKELNWSHGPFEVPKEIYENFNAREKGHAAEKLWNKHQEQYAKAHPEDAAKLSRRLSGDLPLNWDKFKQDWLSELLTEAPKVATRKASQMALDKLSQTFENLFGGSADLTGSNLTNYKDIQWINNGDFSGHYLSYGVREFGMAAMMNGMCLHGGFIPYGGTFLVFSDYARNAIRMSALMKLPVIYVMTHDSIGLGEDGPTHQPIEHVSSLRLVPNLNVWRPADAFETAVAWQVSVEEKESPSLLALSRQGLPTVVEHVETSADIRKGGYVLRATENPQVSIVATGSEVELAINSAKALADKGVKAQVVSVPCVEKFNAQGRDYVQRVIPKDIPAVFIEAGTTALWYQFMPTKGSVIGLDHFGESAPAGEIFKEFGFTVENVVSTVESLIN